MGILKSSSVKKYSSATALLVFNTFLAYAIVYPLFVSVLYYINGEATLVWVGVSVTAAGICLWMILNETMPRLYDTIHPA